MTPSSALERVSKKDEALSLALGALSPRHAGRPVGPPTTSQVVTASHVMPPLEAVYGEFPDIVRGQHYGRRLPVAFVDLGTPVLAVRPLS